eukprot:NODE_906_length_1384_cov_118.095880_g754_i0.p2 GENE.NODE_906_length_1384_cov_118.095880_g754_i0~~NODE_906_length_1384_cov_118.095880_g754_i0.p2  ORF type:complete len:87 (+),score=1.99 NODE_906_length_1384_cov_118.095880_g754_i0:170-430(+)
MEPKGKQFDYQIGDLNQVPFFNANEHISYAATQATTDTLGTLREMSHRPDAFHNDTLEFCFNMPGLPRGGPWASTLNYECGQSSQF